ncbi:MAG: hypothetical protein Fur0020_09200 [Thermodesulfovibrionia bacterium]
MNIYEEVIILDPTLDEKGVEDILQKVNDIITSNGGEVLKKEDWGVKKLAYELNKYQKGRYILLLFRSIPSIIPELERFARITEQIVKIMVVKIKKKRHITAVMAPINAEEPTTVTSTTSAQRSDEPAKIVGDEDKGDEDVQ